MNNDLKVFKNEVFGEIRTVILNGEVWFVAKDVCTILEIQNTTQALENLDNDERSMFNIGRQGVCNIINESGLYALIIRSRKPEAKKFRKWITSEVLPEIRKTGAYSKAPKTYAEALRQLASEVEQKELAEKQRDKAIREKSWIGTRREATAMNTASQKAKEVKKLQIELDRDKSFATIKRVYLTTGTIYNWKKLLDYCKGNGLTVRKVYDSNYDSVNSYPAVAWENVYNVDLSNLY